MSPVDFCQCCLSLSLIFPNVSCHMSSHVLFKNGLCPMSLYFYTSCRMSLSPNVMLHAQTVIIWNIFTEFFLKYSSV